ncbi:MAG: phosphate acetyltransferase, partial [Robiginitalea sp.]
MNKAIYIATMEANSGKSIVTLGLMHLLLGKMARVGYFRPIINDYPEGEKDNHIETVLTYFGIPMEYEETYACTRSEVVLKNSRNQEDEVLDAIIGKFKAIEGRFDFVLVEGTDFEGEGAIIEWDFNVLIAKNLGIPTLIISTGQGKTMKEFVNSIVLACDSFADNGVQVLMVVANKVQEKNRDEVLNNLRIELPESVLLGAIPLNSNLAKPSIREIADAIQGKVLFGEEHLDNQAGHFGVGAMQLRNYLGHMGQDALVITPGDRADIILGALQANISNNYPTVSGIVLTGGLIPEDTIIRLIEGLSEIVPIISAEDGTYSVTNRIGSVRPRIYPENHQKIRYSIKDFSRFVPEGELAERLITFKAEGITPRMFQFNLLNKARSSKKRIVLPEGTDERILRASRDLVNAMAVDITLLGNREEIIQKIQLLGLDFDLGRVQIIDPRNSDNFQEYAHTLYELRKHKNMDPATARDLMEDVSYYGTMMVHLGHADGMVSGAMHTTQHTIRPALQFIKTKPG